MSNVALVVVDVQHDFLDPNMSRLGSWEKAFCVPGVHHSLAVAREHDWRIIHVGTRHDGAHTLPAHQQRRRFAAYCERGSDGVEFVVAPGPGETVIYKQWYSAFDADLGDHLEGVETVVWAGVATDCCIYQSAFDGDRRGLRNIVPIQAVSASKREAFVASLVGLAKSAAEVIDVSSLAASASGGAVNLDPDELAQIARAWFEAQQSRIGTASAKDLASVLALLG